MDLPPRLDQWLRENPGSCASHLERASSRLKNYEEFRHSARNDPLNDSMKALSVGFPGRQKSRVTPFIQAQRSSALLMNSGRCPPGWFRACYGPG